MATSRVWRVLRAKLGPMRTVVLGARRWWGTRAYSQEGEDMILRRVFAGTTAGTYVDVGAHHPFRFSNTYHFYRSGWTGLNVDATPGSMHAFRYFRRRDVSVEVAVGSGPSNAHFNIYSEPALNGFCTDAELSIPAGVTLTRSIEMETVALAELLDRHGIVDVDFLSIDVEGHELEVLRSGDWSRHRPRVIVVEALGSDLASWSRTDVAVFLNSKGYRGFAKSLHSLFFAEESFIDTHPAFGHMRRMGS